jgi:hypothetical protein
MLKDFTKDFVLWNLIKNEGFIDKNGVEVISCKYNYLNNFSDGLELCVDTENAHFFFIDKANKIVS